jgi:YesN/AraC family two-component response regulator
VCGNVQCIPGKINGPRVVKDRFSIHYVHSGKGIYKMEGKTYELSAGQGFLVIPNKIIYYEADRQDPWNYSWIGFHGYKSETYLHQAGLTAYSPIFQAKNPQIEDCFLQIQDVQVTKEKELRLNALLCYILSLLIEEAPILSGSKRNDKQLYVNSAIDFIADNYTRNITISEISKHVGFDQSYFGAIFKSHMLMTLQQFLIHFRIERACGLMQNKDLSIGDIARSVGYENPVVFTRAFKKIKVLSPNRYRKTIAP